MMAQVVLFPDATDVVIDYLATELAARGNSAPVRSRVPNPRPAPFVLVRRLGGPRRDLVTDSPMIGVECWAASEADAHDLAQLCRALVFAMRGTTQSGVAVYGVDEVGGLANLPDPLSDHPRYIFTTTINMRGQAE